MNRDQIWQQLKDEKETVYGKKMLEVFLSITEKLNIEHLEEALDSGYEVNDTAIRSNIVDILNSRREKILLDKIIKNKKDMSSKLMYHILNAMNNSEIKDIAPKMNLNKMNLDDVYNLVWLKIENIELMRQLFEDKLKQFDVKQIINLIKEGSGWKIDGLLDQIVNALGGWKNIIEKMRERPVNIIPDYYQQLKINLNDSKLNKYFAKKIIENDKNAIGLAQFFDPEI